MFMLSSPALGASAGRRQTWSSGPSAVSPPHSRDRTGLVSAGISSLLSFLFIGSNAHLADPHFLFMVTLEVSVFCGTRISCPPAGAPRCRHRVRFKPGFRGGVTGKDTQAGLCVLLARWL